MLHGLFGFELVVEMSILPAITSDPYLDGRREPRGENCYQTLPS